MADTISIFQFIPSLGLVILLAAVFLEVMLAIIVLRNNAKSATNIIFFLLSVVTILWLATAYVVNLPQFYPDAIALARLGIFFAAPMSLFFFLLANTIPSERLSLKKSSLIVSIAATLLMMGLNLSPYAFTDATSIVQDAIHPVPGWGLIPFAIISTLFSIFAVYSLIKKFRRATGIEREQVRIVFLAMLIILALLITTVLIPIVFFGSGIFIVFTPIYTLIFLGMTGYAIVKYGLFNLKIIATEALTLIICIILLSNIFGSATFVEWTVNLFVFVAMVVLGAMLINGVKKEVQQKEELQQLNKQIQNKNKQLEELSRFKSELLSLASHQIKSPLAAIKGFASLISDGAYGEIGDAVKETIGKIQHSADDLIELINTLLDVRKVEEGKMEYFFEKIDIAELVAAVINSMEPLAEAKKLSLIFDFQKKQIFVTADKEKLKQVIQNLIDNAIKYTPSGFVKIELHEDAKDRAGGTVTIIVSDSGLGIPSDLIPHLFEEFVRDERVKKEIRGTGLGLYIARKIAEAHGGTISAQSRGEGKGSVFRATIPLSR